MEKEILNKINSDTSSLTNEDYKIISSNTELRETLINKIAAGSEFNIESFADYLGEELLTLK